MAALKELKEAGFIIINHSAFGQYGFVFPDGRFLPVSKRPIINVEKLDKETFLFLVGDTLEMQKELHLLKDDVDYVLDYDTLTYYITGDFVFTYQIIDLKHILTMFDLGDLKFKVKFELNDGLKTIKDLDEYSFIETMKFIYGLAANPWRLINYSDRSEIIGSVSPIK